MLLGAWQAQAVQPAADAAPAGQADVDAWLEKIQAAPRQHGYSGEVAVTIRGRTTHSLIAHVRGADGAFIDRIETPGGRPRITYRQGDEVLTLWPQARQAVREKRDPLLSFPNLLQGPGARLAQFYAVEAGGSGDEVAGLASRRVDFRPLDAWRYRYRVWTENRTGLPVKMQILDSGGRVLEQSVFSSLALDPQVDAAALERQRPDLQDYQVKTSSLQRTTAAQEGWRLARAVPGFESMSCYRRLLDHAGGQAAMQWIYSDGLASVSLFLQPFDSARHQHEVQLAQGATQVLTRRIQDWWLTAVGEVPPQTLQAFADGLERLP